jgi:hypothetical protein
MPKYTLIVSETTTSSYTDKVFYEVIALSEEDARAAHAAGESKETFRKTQTVHEDETQAEVMEVELC